MKKLVRLYIFAVLALAAYPAICATPEAPHIPEDLTSAIEGFSSSTKVDGPGWAAYAGFLHPDHSRWYVGRRVFDRQTLVDSVRDWWNAGTRVAQSHSEILHTDISANLAVIRKKVTETYTDLEGNENGSFDGYVTQVWLRENGQWKLLSLDIYPRAPGPFG